MNAPTPREEMIQRVSGQARSTPLMSDGEDADEDDRDARIAELEEENAELRIQIEALQGDNDVLVFAVAQCREVQRLRRLLDDAGGGA